MGWHGATPAPVERSVHAISLLPMMRRILAAVDRSPRVPKVIGQATELAKQFGASLVIFRAVDVPPEFPPAAATRHGDVLTPKLLTEAQTELEMLGKPARALGIETTVRVVAASDAARAIVDAAEAVAADAIVVGSHGYHVIDRVLGTNAARVADRARCTVIVVH